MILKLLSILLLSLYNFHQIGINKKNINEIINYTNNNNYLAGLKKVVYTAMLGKYDKVRSIVKEKGYDYFILTDQTQIENNSGWTILNVEKHIKNLNMNIFKKQRFFKTHPHLFFKDYDLSIYLDSTFEIKGQLDEFLLRILTPKLSIYVLEHPDRNTIFKEMDVVMALHKDSNETIFSVKKKYNDVNFPDISGLAECCLIIRKHNDLFCKNFMNNWFYEIQYNSHRDQLSFNYILWKFGNKGIKYIEIICYIMIIDH